jgi:hypothetical protein
MLVHGYSKVGKSLLAASTPAPRLYLDVESASRFLPINAVMWDPRDPPPSAAEMKKVGADTAVVSIREWTDATQALEWLTQGQHDFKSISLDSVSELQYRNVEHIAGRGTVKIQDWGQVLREVGGYIRDLRDLTFHPTNPIEAIVVTSMSKENKAGILAPQLQGQMAAVIPYLLDICAYLYVETDENGNEARWLLTRRRDGKEAGERVNGRVPPLLKLPVVSGATLEDIRKKNITFQLIMRKVFAQGAPAVEKPAHVEVVPATATVDAAMQQQQEDQ